MKIVIAPDSFKGSASSSEISQWLSDGIMSHISQFGIEKLNLSLLPIADGGEGSLDAAIHAGFIPQNFTVSGPTGNPVSARIGLLGDVALVELAEASGLNQLANHRREPMHASSFGTGELITHALDTGAKKIILAIGGSACTDAGAGALQALGAHLRDTDGIEIPHGGAALARCASIDLSELDPRIASTEFILASDVENPLKGPSGAATIYGPQKGASPDEMRQLDAALTHFASIAGDKHVSTPGAGAAGGFGYMAITFLSARNQSGIKTFLAMSGFDSLIEGADYVITGEGRFDSQSMDGKAPMGIYEAASKRNIPVILVCGQALLNSSGNNSPIFRSIYQLTDFESNLEKCINNPRPIVEKIGKVIAESIVK